MSYVQALILTGTIALAGIAAFDQLGSGLARRTECTGHEITALTGEPLPCRSEGGADGLPASLVPPPAPGEPPTVPPRGLPPVPPPTCSDATPEYCHAPGENGTGSYELGLQWLGVEIAGLVVNGVTRPPFAYALGPDGAAVTEHYREGDPFTEGIRRHDSIDEARADIAGQLATCTPGDAACTSGRVDFHYGDPEQFSAEDRGQVLWDNIDSVASFGSSGMPIEQAFMGSYDLEWTVVGYDDAGNPVVEFHLTNASTWNSALPDPDKVNADRYGNQSAGDGHDHGQGEWWTRQSVRWRETFPGGRAPERPGEWRPQPGPFMPPGNPLNRPSVILKPIWENRDCLAGLAAIPPRPWLCVR